MTELNENERSTVIDLISEINSFLSTKDLMIKKAGGETTIRLNSKKHMFPDMLLYGDVNKSTILQGWEFKMPDVPIEDADFINDAGRKANALGLKSFVLWNFTYAVLYVKKGETFVKEKTWSKTSFIRTRNDVETRKREWEKNLDTVIYDINQYLISGNYRESFIGDALATNTITTMIDRNKKLLAEYLKTKTISDSVMGAYISSWWESVKIEYSKDESDMFSAYSKTLILNWANRIIFAHLIKKKQNKASVISTIASKTTPTEANHLFEKISSECDFYNIFKPLKFSDILPEQTWQDLLELAIFLNESNIENVDQSIFQNILEKTITGYKKEINGQFTTPPELAKILSSITIRDWTKNIYDCCCGTGTIARFVLQNKKAKIGIQKAIETTWASDKNSYPLQIANINLADSDGINYADRLFQKNALCYNNGDYIELTNPQNGESQKNVIPSFHAIISNLPFVHFEVIPEDDKAFIQCLECSNVLDKRSDLSYYIPFSVNKILDEDGYLGIVLSNSWTATIAGASFFNELAKKYKIMQIHISGKGRWFHNADIVTTLLILQKGVTNRTDKISFFLWNKSLEELAKNESFEKALIDSSLLGDELNKDVVSISKYTFEEINSLRDMNLSYNSLFHGVNWVRDFKDKLVQMNKVFNVFRGSRRGWDPLFYPGSGTNSIETRFLSDVLLNSRDVDTLDAQANGKAFCCHLSKEELKSQNCNGALEWISRFEGQSNQVGKPLTTILKSGNLRWYEMSDKEKATFFTTMNPEKRFFFGHFETPTFINQRLIGLSMNADYEQYTDAVFAILNSILTTFFIESSGFGRGLGVLDLNKETISKTMILNPSALSISQIKRINEAFKPIRQRKIQDIDKELCLADRLNFEKVLFESFNIEHYLPKVIESLKSEVKTRLTAKE